MVRDDSKINRARRGWLATFGMLGLMLLFSHQNCAPAHMVSPGAGQALTQPIDNSIEAPLPVSVIDDTKIEAALSFPFNEVEIEPRMNELDLRGQCSINQSGTVLGWKINKVNSDGTLGEMVATDSAVCDAGSFQVLLRPIDRLFNCGLRFHVQARIGMAKPAETIISRRCGS